MNHILNIILFLNITFSNAYGASLLTFMKEDNTGKQVWIANEDGTDARAITSGNLWHLYPRLSADGKKITYVEGTDSSHLKVMVQNLENAATEALTSEGNFLHPRFSGDGHFLAFSASPAPGAPEQIGIIDLHSIAKNINWIESTGRAFFPHLSSDGSILLFQITNNDGTKQILIQDLQTGEKTEITSPTARSMAPQFSADETKVVYTSLVDGNWDVYVYNRLNKTHTRITTHSASDLAPTFAADGSIYYASNLSGHFAIYKYNEEESLSVLIPVVNHEDADLYAPSFSGNTRYTQSTLRSMQEPARSSFGAIEHLGKVYVVGGHQGHEHTYPESSFLSLVEIYNPANNSWSSAAPRIFPAHGFSIVGYGNYIYAFGGFAFDGANSPRWKSLDVIERYNISTNTWEVVGRMPRPRSSNVAALVDGKVYLMGGWDSTPRHRGDLNGRFHPEIDIFDLATETSSVAPYLLPNPLRRAFTGVVKDGKIILIGGLGEGGSHFELLNEVTELDPTNGSFSSLPSLPFKTFAPAAGIINNTLFVFGGGTFLDDGNFAYVNHIFSLEKEASLWTHTGRYLNESKGFPMVVNLTPTRLGILGGHAYSNGTDAPVLTFESFSED